MSYKQIFWLMGSLLGLALLILLYFVSLPTTHTQEESITSLKPTKLATKVIEATPTSISEDDLWVESGVLKDDGYWSTHQVAVGSSFQAVFHLHNHQPAKEYLFTCLLDYRQVPCIFEGHEQLLYPLQTGNFTEHNFTFETPPLTPGFHDFIMLAFVEPHNHSLDESFRMDISMSMPASRLVLLAGSEPWAVPNIKPLDIGQPLQSEPLPFWGALLDQEIKPLERRMWLTEEVKPQTTVPYYIHFGHPKDTIDFQTIAVITFLDYQQIPIDGQEEWVNFVKLPADKEATVVGTFTTSIEEGVHELQAIYLLDPYQMLEYPPSGNNRTWTEVWGSVYPTNRTEIIVRD